MVKNTKFVVAMVALAVLLVPVAAAMAQEMKVTEEATIEVLKVMSKQAGGTGHTKVVQNLKTKRW